MKKFLSENASWNPSYKCYSASSLDINSLCADVLLMYVEALIDAPGPVADVYTKIDLVSSRRDARFTNWFNSGSNA